MVKLRFLAFLVLLLVGLSTIFGTITMKVAWAETVDPYGHPCSAAMNVFKNSLEILTNGEVKVELYPDMFLLRRCCHGE